MKRRRSLRIELENTHRCLKAHVLERTFFPKLLMSFSYFILIVFSILVVLSIIAVMCTSIISTKSVAAY